MMVTMYTSVQDVFSSPAKNEKMKTATGVKALGICQGGGKGVGRGGGARDSGRQPQKTSDNITFGDNDIVLFLI